MEQKKLIIIGVLCVVICIFAGAIFGILTNTVNYEKIELTANGTTIEIPSNNLSFQGNVNGSGIDLWTFSNNGRLISFNSEVAFAGNGLYGLAGAVAFKDIKDLVFNHFKKQERVDDFIVYTLDANVMNPDGKGDIYCIMLTNNDTHDNMIIVAGTQDIALHMAKSVQYKASGSVSSNSTASTNGGGSSSSEKLIPIKSGDGSVEYFHVGEIISQPTGYYRVNADGSLTKVADDPGNTGGSSSSGSSSSSSSSSSSGGQSNQPSNEVPESESKNSATLSPSPSPDNEVK